MSTLAGALDSSLITSQRSPVRGGSQDVDMSPPRHEQKAALQQDEEMTDLFGNEEEAEETKVEDVTASASPEPSGPESDRLATPEREHREALEYGEDDAPPEIPPREEKEQNVAFPNIPVPRSSDGNTWVLRVPNFMKVDSKPFHPDTYIGPEHDEEYGHHAENVREKSMSIKLKVENTLRWRWTKDQLGVDRRQSNARVIRWSDGTLSLRLGKELFDIHQSIDNAGATSRQSLGTPSLPHSQSQSQLSSQAPAPGLKSQGLTYLVAQHKRSQVLQAEAVITGYMSLQPTGMQSETHRMLVKAVGQKHNKVARLRMAPDPLTDPEREKMELMKQSARKTRTKRGDADDGLGTRRRRYSRKTASQDMWSDDEEDAGDIFAGSDEDEEGGGSNRRAKKQESGRKAENYQADDFLVPDSDEEDDGPRKKKDEDEDELERLDAKISAQEGSSRSKKDGSRSDEDEDEDTAGMDVGSEGEEEEEGLKVRRSGASSRKRAIYNDDEDEDEDE
ncbi:hypothetical protein AX16_001464 [Volvariella volvacea WC 439]|nr:hypothetical protein AX16_001464 [Volvariella volvacea WC 439]